MHQLYGLTRKYWFIDSHAARVKKTKSLEIVETSLNNLLISIIIPNYNGADTLRQCLTAATSLADEAYEVIVVDDGSKDASVDIIREFPCHLVALENHVGTSWVRNIGAEKSQGEILFFTDSDCLIQEDTLKVIRQAVAGLTANDVIGGTYTLQPHDQRFFSRFQSVFINYSETKRPQAPDYLASHALAIDATTFRNSGGFAEDFLPILEDVELSHRLRRAGNKLLIVPKLQVQHIFNYSLKDSLCNAFRKSRYWAMYSLQNHDLLADSGTASHELKVNVTCLYLSLLILAVSLGTNNHFLLMAIGLLAAINLIVNRNLLRAFYDANGLLFALVAYLYYSTVYPLPIGAGIISGFGTFLLIKRQ